VANHVVTRIQAEIVVLSDEIRQCISARLEARSDERKEAIDALMREKREKRKTLEDILNSVEKGVSPTRYAHVAAALDEPDSIQALAGTTQVPPNPPEPNPEFVAAAKARDAKRTVAEPVPDKDPEQDPDEFDDTLPNEEPGAFDPERAQRDFVYFCEHCLTITYRPGMNKAAPLGGSGPMILTSAQRKVAAYYIKKVLVDREPCRTITLKGRQLGHTTFALAFAAWMIWLHPSYHVMLIIDKNDHASTKRQEFVSWFDTLTKRYPGVFPAIKRGTRETKQIGFTNRSRMFFESAESSNPGTSEKVDFLITSEMPKWPAGRASTVMRSVGGAIPFAPYTIIMNESTADGVDAFKRQWDLSTRGGDVNAPTPIFLSWTLSDEYHLPVPPNFAWSSAECHGDWDDDADKWISEEEYAQKYALARSQILWRRAKISGDFSESRSDFDKEYPTSDVHAYRSVGAQFFPRNVIKAATGEMTAVSNFELVDASGYAEAVPCPWQKVRPTLKPSITGNLVVRSLPEKDKRYYIGVDTSEGLEIQTASGELVRDATVALVVDESGFEVAYLTSNDPIEQLWHDVVMLALLYNNAVVNGEKNNTGLVLMTNMVLTGYPNLWARSDPGKSWRDRIWFITNNKTRRAILSALRTFISADVNRLLLTPYVAEQILNFIKGKDGHPRAAHGYHDDVVLAKAMALVCLPGGEDVLGKVVRMGSVDEVIERPSPQPKKNVLSRELAAELLGYDEEDDIGDTYEWGL
jgi:hypothetical protein